MSEPQGEKGTPVSKLGKSPLSKKIGGTKKKQPKNNPGPRGAGLSKIQSVETKLTLRELLEEKGRRWSKKRTYKS